MIEFLKNLFFKKKEDVRLPNVENVEHYVRENDIHIYVNRDAGMIKIEAPADMELSQSEIIEICKEYYED